MTVGDGVRIPCQERPHDHDHHQKQSRPPAKDVRSQNDFEPQRSCEHENEDAHVRERGRRPPYLPMTIVPRGECTGKTTLANGLSYALWK